MDRAMGWGESLRPRMRCTQCHRRDARIDYCAHGDYYSDEELDRAREATDERQEYEMNTVGFSADAYEPMRPLSLGGYDDADAS